MKSTKLIQGLLFVLFGICPVFAQTNSMNYIISRSYKHAGAGANQVNNVDIDVQYLDGLGRPVQRVSVGKSKSGSDLVVPTEYDGFGRQIREFLPYTAAGNGSFKGAAISSQSSFYSGNIPELDNSDLGRPFKRTTLENAPNGRILNERAPGNSSDSSKITYGSNVANEVKLYIYSGNTVTQSNHYAAGRLYKIQVTDENAKISTEYKDINGLLICKTQTDGGDMLSTYYVYDDLNRLRAVLQPKYQDDASTDRYAFLYNYDNRGRIVSKSIPSQGTTFLVYDNYDRVVLSQDELQRTANKWGFIKYDIFSRVAMTGELISASTQSQWQSSLNASTAHHEDKAASTVGYTLANTLPNVVEANVLIVNYYDDYGFIKPANLNFNGITFGTTSIPSPKNLKTGARIRMLTNGANWLVAAVYYDAEYRVVQTARELDNLGNGAYERVSLKYKHSLAGVVEKEQTDQLVSGAVTNSLLKTYTYDHAERLLEIKEKIILGGSKTREAVTLAHRYNELGQLKEKWLHSDNGLAFRRKVQYTSNIRGWHTSVITRYWPTDENAAQYNFYGLQYDFKQASGKYTNGNVTKMLWIGPNGTTFTKGLSFTYDGANRLKSSSGLDGYADIESGISYDKNGNILSLVRAGDAVDNLAYSYTAKGNRVTSIQDNSGNNTGFKAGGAKTFDYDGNGNMISDGNRGATITYNYLNLPQTATMSGSPVMSYNYDASGLKHQYISTVDTVKYAGPFEYNKLNTVKRVTLSEGQAVIRKDTLWFDIYLKDHLGNVRMVLDDKGRTVQKSDYYPFGLEINRDVPVTTPLQHLQANRYNFLGRETQVGSNYMDLKRRFYDPVTGRFIQADPVTETQEHQSTYQYGWNNPILRSDPNGDLPECCGGVGDFLTGIGQAVNDNMGWGNPLTAQPGYVNAFNAGRTVGQYASIVVGAAEIAGGAIGLGASVGAEVGSGGLATPVVAVIATGSAALVAHGGSTAMNAIDNLKNDKGRVNADGKRGSEENPHESSRAARRETMREHGIPTSSQPKSQTKNQSGREYNYGNKSVQQQTKDRSHVGKPHWEAGTIKQRDGKIQTNDYGRPKLENVPKKSKSYYYE